MISIAAIKNCKNVNQIRLGIHGHACELWRIGKYVEELSHKGCVDALSRTSRQVSAPLRREKRCNAKFGNAKFLVVVPSNESYVWGYLQALTSCTF